MNMDPPPATVDFLKWRNNYIILFRWCRRNRRLPSTSGQDETEKRLWVWFDKQMDQMNGGILSKEQIDFMKKMLMQISPPPDEWVRIYQKAMYFTIDNLRLPSSTASSTEGELGKWLITQRQELGMARLRPELMDLIENLILFWDTPGDDWMSSLQEAHRFIINNKRHPEPDSKEDYEASLGMWMRALKRSHHAMKLSPKKLKLVDELLTY